VFFYWVASERAFLIFQILDGGIEFKPIPHHYATDLDPPWHDALSDQFME
jgi:hypothetical protein